MDDYIRVLVTGFFECYLSWNQAKKKDALQRIHALSDLLVRNKAYLRDFSHQGKKDPEQELLLAQEWKRVGAMFHVIYPQLSQLCNYKSDYWVNSDLYTIHKVRELGITIKNLELQYKNALQKLM